MREKLIQELSEILGITITDVIAFPHGYKTRRNGYKKLFHWEITTDIGVVSLTPYQFFVQNAF